jgi:LPS-assembly protein
VILLKLTLFAYEVDISASNIEYTEETGEFNARGNVILTWQGKKMGADYMNFIVNKNVSLEESENIFYAGSDVRNYNKKNDKNKEVFSHGFPLFMRIKHIKKHDNDDTLYTLSDVVLSNCDLDAPHTYFKAKRGKLILNKRVTLFFPLFYVGKVPIFYLPFITKSLGGWKSPFSVRVEPGWSGVSGNRHATLKTKISFPLSEYLTVGLRYNYLGLKRNDYIGSLDYIDEDREGQNKKGNAHVYILNGLNSKSKEWFILSDYFQKKDKKWVIRSRMRLMNDNKFNENFYRDNWMMFRNIKPWGMSKDIKSYISFSRYWRSTNLEVRLQKSNGIYEMLHYTLPKISFVSYYKNTLLDVTRSFALTYTNDYEKKYDNHRDFSWNNANKLGLYYELRKPFRLGKRFTFKPSLKIMETFKVIESLPWENSHSRLYKSFTTSFKSSLNLRFRLTSFMDWNLYYLMESSKKLDPITSLVTFSNNVYFGDKIQIKNWISYNFRLNGEISEKFKNSFTPLNTEMTWFPGRYVIVYVQQSLFLNSFKFKSCKVDLTIGPAEKVYFNFGSFYQGYDNLNMPYIEKHKIKSILGVGLWITPKWEFYYNVRTTSSIKLSYRKIDEHEFNLFRDLHCYILGIIWKLKNGENNIYLKFDMKTNMPFSRRKEAQRLRSF